MLFLMHFLRPTIRGQDHRHHHLHSSIRRLPRSLLRRQRRFVVLHQLNTWPLRYQLKPFNLTMHDFSQLLLQSPLLLLLLQQLTLLRQIQQQPCIRSIVGVRIIP